MKILYADVIPANVFAGIIFFNLKARVMSAIKSKIWKTFSHTGVVYRSAVSGVDKMWISYMDEIYGLISCPLDRFIQSESVVGWAIRPLKEPQSSFARVFKECVMKHSGEESHLYISEEGEITGSFDDELRTILGIPVCERVEGFNTNIGYVEDILQDVCQRFGMKTDREKSIEFDDERDQEEELMEQLSSIPSGKVPDPKSGEEMLKSINQLLGMVNLTTQTVRPPIQVLISQPHRLLQDGLIKPSDVFRVEVSEGASNSIYPNLGEERKHVAEVISKMFASGLSTEGVREVFEEELDTTVLARRGRSEMTKELLEEMLNSLEHSLSLSKILLEKNTSPTAIERQTYNESLQELVTAEASLLVHLGMERKVNIGKFQI